MSPPEAAKSSRNYKVRKGMRVQTRDREIIWMTGTHGLVTMMHLKLFAFEGKDETGRWRSVSEQAVYRRLGKLCEAGFLEHQRTWYGDHGVYRATKAGLSLVGLDLSPARLDRRDYEHDLQVVDLALWLTDYSCDGWIPERMIRSRLKVGMSIGRVPDGLLIGPGGERWAVELEVSGKESQRYYEACHKYAERHRTRIPDESSGWDMEEYLDDYFESGGEVDGVVWYFFSEKKRQRALAEANKIVAARSSQRQRTDHLHLRFHTANIPTPPPFQKWKEQQRREEEEEEEEDRNRHEREEERRREEEARQEQLYRQAWTYLSEEEQRRVREVVAHEFRGRPRWMYDSNLREAVIKAASEKHRAEQEKEEKRQRRKDAVKSWFTGR